MSYSDIKEVEMSLKHLLTASHLSSVLAKHIAHICSVQSHTWQSLGAFHSVHDHILPQCVFYICVINGGDWTQFLFLFHILL